MSKPIEHEDSGPQTDKLLGHEYDGIQEFDNPLPGWWTWIFWLSILFAPLYAVYYHAKPGRLPVDEYGEETRRLGEIVAAEALKQDISNESLAKLATDPNSMDKAKAIFVAKCAQCHLEDGGGKIGPNLTDEYWLHGGQLVDIYKTINEGVPEKGMVAWGKQLGPVELRIMAAYVSTLQGTTPAAPKAPEGEKATN